VVYFEGGSPNCESKHVDYHDIEGLRELFEISSARFGAMVGNYILNGLFHGGSL
jgi:hypothetical protein